MRAIRIREPGGPEVLQIADVPEPSLEAASIRVRVRWAGVNRADLLQRMGFYPAPPGAPRDIPGLEYAGEVLEVAPGVKRLASGDRVFGVVPGGGYAEQVVVHEREAALLPPGIDLREAGAVPEAFATAWDALVARGGLVPGERVLVHAVGSGVGTAVVQLARALGCEVTGTSRTPRKLEAARALGLTHGVLSKDLAAMRAELAQLQPEGWDVIVDLVGGAMVAEDIHLAASRGRIVLVGLTAGVRAELDLARLLSRRVTLVGTVLRARPLEEKILVARELERTIGPWLAEGRLRAVIDRTYPLAEAAAAHRALAADETFGKVLLALD
jgi:putative PIG3 family NAD(P)H quinone oxidoreductase